MEHISKDKIYKLKLGEENDDVILGNEVASDKKE